MVNCHKFKVTHQFIVLLPQSPTLKIISSFKNEHDATVHLDVTQGWNTCAISVCRKVCARVKKMWLKWWPVWRDVIWHHIHSHSGIKLILKLSVKSAITHSQCMTTEITAGSKQSSDKTSWIMQIFGITLPAQRGRVLYCISFFLLLSSSSSFFFFFLLLSVNMPISQIPYVRLCSYLVKVTSLWTRTVDMTSLGSKVTTGSQGSKRSFSPKLLFFLQITWYGHVTHAYWSARYPLQKLWS